MDSEQEVITESPTRDDDDTDSEDEVEEDEPALKYERIMGNVPELFKKDSASTMAVCGGVIALGTHTGFIHLLDHDGKRLKSYKPHTASILDISFDAAGEFLVTASMDGLVHIQSISFSTSVQNSENYTFDFKRPMRTVALEPNFARKSTRAFVCGGLAGILTLKEKGWLGGHSKETVLQYPASHNGASTAEEGPIWLTRWHGRFIAWANDRGVKIYDTQTQSRIALIDRDEGSPRGEMLRCFMEWQDNELVIGWGEFVKIIRIRERQRIPGETTSPESPLLVEITQVLRMDGMIAGIVPYSSSTTGDHRHSIVSQTNALSGKTEYSPGSFLLLTHTSVLSDETSRPTSSRPELRIVSRAGEEESSDMIGVSGFERWGSVDYSLTRLDAPLPSSTTGKEVQSYIVLSPLDLILVRPRDARDHVDWLVEHKQWEEAMTALEELEEGSSTAHSVRQQYITHLISVGDFASAASLLPKLCTSDPKLWENYIFVFTQHQQLNLIIPFVPTSNPQLENVVYELILAHFLSHDPTALLKTVKEWPKGIYDVEAVIIAVRGEVEGKSKDEGDLTVLMECLAELYTLNRQPGKALPYFLRLKRESVFELIRENNLQTDVKDKDMVLGLVEFDWELMRAQRKADTTMTADDDEELGQQSRAIRLLVDNIHSIPISHVVRALDPRPNYLFHYLDALVRKDLALVEEWGDLLVTLYAQYAPRRLIDFLRASTDYNLEKAYNVCQERDLVTEMVFLLGQMGNNKKALTIIIERLGDVNLAIDFAKEQADDDLWEDLLKYSETRPTFIRGLLENVGSEINPIRLIRRIKNGLEIPGLKEALIKILQDFHLQISLMEGCQRILEGDELEFSKKLWKDQSSGFFLTAKTNCPICMLPIQRQNGTQDLVILFLCRHVVHSACVKGGEAENLPTRMDPILRGIGMGGQGGRGLSGKIAFESMVRARLEYGCPVCHERTEGTRQQTWTR